MNFFEECEVRDYKAAVKEMKAHIPTEKMPRAEYVWDSLRRFGADASSCTSSVIARYQQGTLDDPLVVSVRREVIVCP